MCIYTHIHIPAHWYPGLAVFFPSGSGPSIRGRWSALPLGTHAAVQADPFPMETPGESPSLLPQSPCMSPASRAEALLGFSVCITSPELGRPCWWSPPHSGSMLCCGLCSSQDLPLLSTHPLLRGSKPTSSLCGDVLSTWTLLMSSCL